MRTWCRLSAPVGVRAWPYPFRAGLSISNDPEYLTLDFLDEFYKFLNTDLSTRFGHGVDLEVTTGGFFFGPPGRSATFLSSTAPDAERSSDAGRLSEFLRSGLIDTNHSFGDFDDEACFVRAHAERTYEELGRLGVTLPLFTNHGNVNNVQNVGRDAAYHRGDRPDSASYHADLLSANGVRFVWTDSLVIPKAFSKRRPWAGLFDRGPSLLHGMDLQDGTKVTGFTRTRGTGVTAPNLGSLGEQIQLIDWDALYRNQGAIVLYQHLGVLERTASGFRPATVAGVMESGDSLLDPWRFLARESQEGRLWVVGAARMLRYGVMLSRVTVTGVEDQGVGIAVEGGSDNDLQGLTIYVEPHQRVDHVLVEDRRVDVRRNDPDETGRYSVTVPARPLSGPW